MDLFFTFRKLNIYNKCELFQNYVVGKESENTSDLLLTVYRNLGIDTPHALIGDFAFAIWDEEKDYFFCARDKMGQSTFYYTFLKGRLIALSSLTEILALLPEKPKPNIESMREFLSSGVNPEPTMYEGIYRLPPGHRMIVRGTEVEVSRYWDPKSIKINYDVTLEEASTRFLELFTEAVSCRLAKEGRTGCDLSGGLDSSSIYCVAKQQGADIEAYSMRFAEMECDEGAYIDDVLAQTGGKGISISEENLDYKERYNLSFHYSSAPHWPNAYASTFSFPVLEAMQKNGIRVVLSGQGGDHVLNGSLIMPLDLLIRGELRAFLREFWRLGRMRKPVFKRFLKVSLRAMITPSLYSRLRYFYRRRRGMSKMLSTESDVSYTDSYRYANSFSQKEMISLLTGKGYSILMDCSIYRVAEERYGISYRHPFFDLRLVEFLLSMPPEYFYSDRQFKLLLRKAMRGILPKSVRERPDKAEFSDVIKQQIDAMDPDIFWKDVHIIRLGIITQQMFEEIRTAYQSSPEDHQRSYWKLINLEQWYRFNYDPEYV